MAYGVQSPFEDECESCSGLGYVKNDYPVSHERFGKLDPCPDCRGDIQIKRLKDLSRLDAALLAADMKLFDPRQHLHRVVPRIQTWMRVGNAGWLTLTGPHGTGKTYLMAAMANLYIEQGTAALYTTVADLLSDLRNTFDPKSDLVYSSLFASVMDVDVLLLDEAEKWQSTAWAEEQVFRMLEHRSRHMSTLKTVLATNTDLRPLIEQPGSASLYPNARYPNYLESRIAGGVIIGDFWAETDFRPIIAAALRQAEKEEEIECHQRELL